jgi:hypothetical protein
MAEIDWSGLLHQEDVEGIWNALYRLVTRHPAARPLRFGTDETAASSELEINADLAQELFLELFQKQRFEYYLANDYSSTEIENELTHIELPNMVGARLRKRYPESFRMARRVSSLLKTSSVFRRFEKQSFDLATAAVAEYGPGQIQGNGHKGATSQRHNGTRQSPELAASAMATISRVETLSSESRLLVRTDNGNGKAAGNGSGPKTASALEETYLEEDGWDDNQIEDQSDAEPAASAPKPRRQRMVNQIYGLKRWPRNKPVGDGGHFSELAKIVPVRQRDNRIVGRSGSSQLIVSNKALEELIVEIFRAIDSPADVKTIRQLTLSKIPLQDYSITSLDGEFARDDTRSSSGKSSSNSSVRASSHSAMAVDTRPTPEDELLGHEHRRFIASLARDFLVLLRRAVNNNPQRYERLLQTLWHCYYDPSGPSQIETAQLLGVSDSLISNNRKLIEHELKKLSLSREDGLVFSEALGQLIAEQNALVVSAVTSSARSVKCQADARVPHDGRRGQDQRGATPNRNRA